jgi:hypothetical protein
LPSPVEPGDLVKKTPREDRVGWDIASATHYLGEYVLETLTN